MSRTLFKYIFLDLLKIFLIASGALSGILSFGGLLRPLTQQGLDAGQVVRILGYLSPAMSAYSFPIAALFATTIVYGRLGADNEITACRAGGMSYFSLSMPAIVLGLLVALISLLFLNFIVPSSMLKVEKVIYSNVAKLVSTRIERNHQVKFEGSTVFARRASVVSDPTKPQEQRVVLENPVVINYAEPPADDRRLRVPTEFYMARSATAVILQPPGEEAATLTLTLDRGLRFPRDARGAMQAGVEASQYGPVSIESPIAENTRFMVVGQLQGLFRRPWESSRVSKHLDGLIAREQSVTFARQLWQDMNSSGGTLTLGVGGDRIEVSAGGSDVKLEDDALLITAAGMQRPRVRQFRDGTLVIDGEPGQIRVSAGPLKSSNELLVTVRMLDLSGPVATHPASFPSPAATVPQDPTAALLAPTELIDPNATRAAAGASPATDATQGTDEMSPTDPMPPTAMAPASNGTASDILAAVPEASQREDRRDQIERTVVVPMPDAVLAVEASRKTPEVLAATGPGATRDQKALARSLVVQSNDIQSELHARAAFAVSCFVLVLAGAALGMMFKSGNYLTAFAVSFIPALLTITLIVAGQRTSQNVPSNLDNNPLMLGITLIWAGNVLVFLLGSTLLWRLNRQ